jgi:hypothetical protein
MLLAFNAYNSGKDLGSVTLSDRISGHDMKPVGMEKTRSGVRGGEPIAGTVSRLASTILWGPKLPIRYKAWTGVRFREPEEDRPKAT